MNKPFDPNREVAGKQQLLKRDTIFLRLAFFLNLIALAGACLIVFKRSAGDLEDIHLGLLVAMAVVLLINGMILFYVERLQSNLEELERDTVTGAFDRPSFEQLLDVEMQRAARYRYSLSLCILELDDFSSFHQSFGPEKGKDLLQKFSSLIHQSIRSADIFGRYDHAQFAVLLPHTDVVQAEKFLARVVTISDKQMGSSFCAGLTEQQAGETRAQFLIRASTALAQAKREGKKQIRCIVGNSDENNFLRF